MNWKKKGYENFSGEYLNFRMDVSSVILERMSDEMKMSMRNKVVAFEQEMFDYMKYIAAEILDEQTNPPQPELTPIEQAIIEKAIGSVEEAPWHDSPPDKPTERNPKTKTRAGSGSN